MPKRLDFVMGIALVLGSMPALAATPTLVHGTAQTSYHEVSRQIAKLPTVFGAEHRVDASGSKLVLRVDKTRWTPTIAKQVKALAGTMHIGVYAMRATLYDTANEIQKLPGIVNAHFSEESNAFVVAVDKSKASPHLEANIRSLAGNDRVLFAPVRVSSPEQ